MTRIDTIVATATAPGPGAVAVLRMSGPDAHGIASALVNPDGLPEAGRFEPRWVRHPGTGERIDQVVVSVFAAPRSYTGEDVVELSGHGGPLAPRLLLEACVEAGGRLAEPGEFTRRAYLNGKMDLIQAEAVLDLVEGRSPALHEAALGQLDRGLSRRLSELRERIVRLEALLVHHIDFPDEDEPPVPLARIIDAGEAVARELQTLLETAPEGELLRDGVVTVLAGAPNSGKSTLFNALVGRDRAIVTDTPGTTRDAIEANVSIGGFPFILVDTAGIRGDAGEIEQMGIEVAERYVADADLVLFCRELGAAEGRGGASSEDAEALRFLSSVEAPVLQVLTKADGIGRTGGWDDSYSDEMEGPDRKPNGIAVSGHTGDGLSRLRDAMLELVFGGLVRASGVDAVLTRKRHADGVRTAAVEVAGFVEALTAGVPAEVAASHLRPAETALESLLGVIPLDEVLDAVFREFCIGK